MPQQTDQRLSWEDILGNLCERALVVETMEMFARGLVEDKLFTCKWGSMSQKQRVNCIDWTEYLSARCYLTRPDALSAHIKLRHCP